MDHPFAYGSVPAYCGGGEPHWGVKTIELTMETVCSAGHTLRGEDDSKLIFYVQQAIWAVRNNSSDQGGAWDLFSYSSGDLGGI